MRTVKKWNAICSVCKEEFEITSKHPNVTYCSFKCARLSRRKRTLVVCQYCGKESETYTNKPKKFCNEVCYTAWRAENLWPQMKEKTENKRRLARKRSVIRKQIDGVWYRRCGRCGEWKQFSEFGKRHNTKDKLSPICKKCLSAKRPESKRALKKRIKRELEEAIASGKTLYKTCVDCGETKELKEFRKSSYEQYGRESRCIICAKKRGKKYRETHKPQILEAQRRHRGNKPRKSVVKCDNGIWFKHCPSCDRWLEFEKFFPDARLKHGISVYCRFCYKVRFHRWRKLSSKSQYMRQLYGIGEREWYLLTTKIASENKRAKELGLDGFFTVPEFIKLCEHFGFRCIHPEHWEVLTLEQLGPDHVIPVSRGGSNKIDNIQPMCFPHNREKQAQTIDYRPQAEERIKLSGGESFDSPLFTYSFAAFIPTARK